MDQIREKLFSLGEAGYKTFQSKLIPTMEHDLFIGVRMPELRKLGRELRSRGQADAFMDLLPHAYFDENNLHALLISEMRDFDSCIARLDIFLPFVDNWATCDSLRPRSFSNHKKELLQHIPGWLSSGHTYTVRFGIEMLMVHFLDDDFEDRFLEMAASVPMGEYYVDMMVAWYFATSLAMQWECTLPWLEEKRLPKWVHNKTVQKAIESHRISIFRKEMLKKLRNR